MSRFKKCAVVNYMEPLPCEGGRKWRAHQFASTLSNSELETKVFTSSFSHFYGKYRLKQNIISHRYSIELCFATPYKTSNKLIRIISQIFFSVSLFFKICNYKPDLVIASYPHSYSLICLSFLKPFLNFKFVVDIRDSLKQPPNDFFSIIYNIGELILSFIWVLSSDNFFGPGDSAYKYLPSILRNFAFKRYYNIPMSYLSEIDFSDNRDKSNTNFIFIGSLTKAFDFTEIFHYFSTTDTNSNLYILGGGPLLNSYKYIYSNQKNIIFLGQVDFKTISKYASISRYGLMPYSSIANRFSYHTTNKLAEYLSFGVIPLIPDHCYEMKDFIEFNSCGIFYNKNNLVSLLNNLDTQQKYISPKYLFDIYIHHLSYKTLSNALSRYINDSN